MSLKSIYSFTRTAVLACLLLSAYDVIAQKESGLTKANECRHVAILPRHDKNEPYTARCFIPSRTIFGSRHFSLVELVDKEWNWVYNHNGTVSGQVIVRGENSVIIISEKMCIDRGKTSGSPYRNFYSKIGNESKPDYPVGDFNRLVTPNDAYADCVNNPTQWYDFKNLSAVPKPLPPDAIQFVRRNIGGHLGTGTKLIPFNFSYTKEKLDNTFRDTLKDALHGTSRDLPSVTSEKPIVIAEYPFEIGLSILGSSTAFSEKTSAVVTQIHHDLSALGWERALQAKAALSGRINSAEEFPENISRAELVSFTVLTFLSIALYWQELRSCAKERTEEISTWNESTGSWVCVRAENSYQYVNVTRIGTVRALVALITSIVSIIASVLIFHDSSLRFQKILRVTQGGVVTYGKTLANFSNDPNNLFAGPEFAVAHWMEIHIIESGYRGLFPSVSVIAAVLFLILIRMTFLFTLLREHHLDHSGVQASLFPLKWIILFLQTLLARLFPARWKKINSYEVSFQKLCRQLTTFHGHQPILDIPHRSIWKVYGRYNLDRFTPNHEADDEAPPVHNRRIHNMNAIMGTAAINRRITRNEIEKAAEVLAANAFGMLSSIQALTLMYGHNLSAAADRYAGKGQLPSVAEVRGLARIWYVQEMVVLSVERQGIPPDNPHRIDVEAHSQGAPPPYTNELNKFSPVIGFRPSVCSDGSKLNDGVAFLTYRGEQ